MKKKLERMARKWVRWLAELKRRAARVHNRIAQLQKQVKWADAQLEAKSCVGVLCCAAGKKMGLCAEPAAKEVCALSCGECEALQ